MSDPAIETVTVLKSTRVGFTKLLCGYFCYRIVLDPCGILAVQPAQEDAEGFSKDDLAPAIEATPEASERVGDPRSRDSDNTILHKRFPDGFLKVVGAHSGRGFRRITVDVAAFDEPDAYPPSAGTEGDQIELGKKRAHTAAFPKFIIGSSPKLKGSSRIWRSWEDSDQRDMIVPCPRCDAGQRLAWGGRDADYGIKWPDGCPEDAYYLCAHCHQRIEHHEKMPMVDQGVWQPAYHFFGHAGFRLWAAYSPFPKAAWPVIADEFLRVKDHPLELQVFVNTVLGEPWEARGHSPDDSWLAERRELYPGVKTQVAVGWSPEVVRTPRDDSKPGEDPVLQAVPSGAAVMTAGVDVQDDRLELQVDGWGYGEECWKLEYHVLWGDPSADAVWTSLWDLLSRPRVLERGGVDYIRATGVDTGGHHTQRAYDFCRPRARVQTPDGRIARIFALKGQSGQGDIWPKRPSRSNRGRIPLYPVRVEPAKQAIYTRLQRIVEPGPGYIHFPRTFGEHYFEGLTAEHCITVVDKRGFERQVWQKKTEGRRNEPFDTAVYSYAVLCGLKSLGLDLDRLATSIGARPPEPEPEPGSTSKSRRPRKRRRRWRSASL